jgi:hypothetical protein
MVGSPLPPAPDGVYEVSAAARSCSPGCVSGLCRGGVDPVDPSPHAAEPHAISMEASHSTGSQPARVSCTSAAAAAASRSRALSRLHFDAEGQAGAEMLLTTTSRQRPTEPLQYGLAGTHPHAQGSADMRASASCSRDRVQCVHLPLRSRDVPCVVRA